MKQYFFNVIIFRNFECSPLSLMCVCKLQHHHTFIIPEKMWWVCCAHYRFSSQKSSSWSPEPEAEMDTGACSAVAGKWETSERLPTRCEFVLINQPLPNSTSTSVHSKMPLRPLERVCTPSNSRYRGETGIKGSLSQESHCTCLVNTAK